MRRRADSRFWGTAWFIFVLALVGGMFSVTFFITTYLYKLIDVQPPLLVAEFINSIMGLVFTGLIVGGISRFARARGWTPEMNVFAPILDALERIAAGDFSVRLEDKFHDYPMVSELTSSVNKMALELHQWESLRQEFISNVSHEIQSPLTSIRGFAQALENDQLTAEERHHYLGIIEDESGRLSRITEDLLKLASLESDHLKLEPKTYRVDHQIRNLVLACEPQWRDKNIKMNVSLDELEITADEDLLSQVWINLIHNAIKFTPTGGSVRVTLCCRREQIEFRISDTGIGISNQDLPRIFERFYKADKSRTRAKEGSGLGLSIVKKIVDLHKGTIEVDSKVSEGATFLVRLPVIAPQAE
ncbi:MAG TPA: HAMP domain-containing sensor histidine kinase [Anaerolineales bacterium]|nr:HAMP domain-containing sensor histidine kinase [Anaerolineales bacterium]